MFAGILSSVYAIVMMIVLLGILKEAVTDQFCSMTTVFLCFVVGVFIVSALLHPQVCKQRDSIRDGPFNLKEGGLWFFSKKIF